MQGLGGERSRILLIAVLCIAVLVLVVVYFLISDTPGYALTVKTIDSSSGAGLASVTATVDGRTETTGPDGIATFNLPQGTYTINLEKDGYQPKSFTITISGDNLITLDMLPL